MPESTVPTTTQKKPRKSKKVIDFANVLSRVFDTALDDPDFESDAIIALKDLFLPKTVQSGDLDADAKDKDGFDLNGRVKNLHGFVDILDNMSEKTLCQMAIALHKRRTKMQKEQSTLNKMYKEALSCLHEMMDKNKNEKLTVKGMEIVLVDKFRNSMITKEFLETHLYEFCRDNVNGNIDAAKISGLMTNHIMENRKDNVKIRRPVTRKTRRSAATNSSGQGNAKRRKIRRTLSVIDDSELPPTDHIEVEQGNKVQEPTVDMTKLLREATM
eukprot:jgi/Bigna1/129921/aug1.10_g4629